MKIIFRSELSLTENCIRCKITSSLSQFLNVEMSSFVCLSFVRGGLAVKIAHIYVMSHK